MAAATGKPEMPTFSYAQAAKGISTASTTSLPSKPASIDQSKGVRYDETNNSSHQPSANVSALPVETEVGSDPESSEIGGDPETQSPNGETQQPVTVTSSSMQETSGTSSPIDGTASTSTLPKDDDISAVNGISDAAWDGQSQASGPNERTSLSEDGKKDSSSNTVSERSFGPRELKAAPIPVVNIWQQRKEAQEAKAKATAAALKSVASNNLSPKTTPGKPPNGVSHPPADNNDGLKTAGKKKPVEPPSDGAASQGKDRKRADTGKGKDESLKKSGNRTSRPGEGTAETTDPTPPPVGDTTAWPTPQTAQGKAQEKGDKSERTEKSPIIRAHGKEKWMPVPYVPTPVFNTPLPRRGPRVRGGRESGRGGGAFASGVNGGSNKAVVEQTAQGTVTKQPSLPDRGRNEPSSTRATSLPAQSRRSNSIDATPSPEQRRAFQAVDRPRSDGRSKGPEDSTNVSVQGAHTANGESNPKHRDSKQTGKNQEPYAAPKGSEHHSRAANSPADSHHGGRFGPNHERRFDHASRHTDVSRDSAAFTPRDRDTREFAKERGEYHRDRDHPRDRGDSRPERSRGGYRGRGGHSYGGSQNSHYSNSQISQHSFISQKSYGFNDRQRSQQHGFQNGSQSHNSSHRMPLRSPSLPSSGGPYSAYPLHDVNTHTLYSYQPLPPGPLTAMPYPTYQEPFSLPAMISMQLEYYFSVDNLCKDLYLRKHMDSQGFVRLSFIANFKRIKTLTEDVDLLRHVCRHLRDIEYQAGEDGVDRLRLKEKWEQWVLHIEQRDPSAQNDGPPPQNPASPINMEDHNGSLAGPRENVSVTYAGPMPLANGSPLDGLHTPSMLTLNGINEHHLPRAPLSSTAPEFTPFVPLVIQSETSNVGIPIDYNTLPDDQVENLVIVVRKQGISSTPQDHVLSLPPRSFSNGSVDGCRAEGTVTSDENPISSPNVAPPSSSRTVENREKRCGNASNLLAIVAAEARGQGSTFWLREKDSPIEAPSSGIVHESYNTFRKRALEKRNSAAVSDGDRDIDVLYKFWSHFLVQNFNANMYNEFKSLAVDDYSRRGFSGGLNNLVRFYSSALLSNRSIPDEVVRDLVDLINTETGNDKRPMFDSLRSAWRNAAFNLKNRRKIDRLLDPKTKAELKE